MLCSCLNKKSFPFFRAFLLLIIVNLLFSCTTTNNSTEKKQRFDDWEYMGFGKEVPLWYEYALDKKNSKLKELIPQVKSKKDVIILKSSGFNLDQSKKKLQELEKEISEDFTFYESFWAKLIKNTREPYISIAVYIRK